MAPKIYPSRQLQPVYHQALCKANALSLEQSVATPLEQQINGVDNMIYMKSTNSNDGKMVIQTSFEVGTDPDMNTVFTQNRVAAATAKLPEEVRRLGVTTEKSLPNILMLITLTSEGDRYDQEFLGNYALINIKDILARTRGVGRVNVLLASDYSMRIWIKPDRLAQLGITDDPQCFARAQATARVLERLGQLWRIGRGRPVDKTAVYESGAVSGRFLDEVARLADGVDGNAERLLRALRDGEIKGFRASKIDALAEHLESNGYLDPRDPLPTADLRVQIDAFAGHSNFFVRGNKYRTAKSFSQVKRLNGQGKAVLHIYRR